MVGMADAEDHPLDERRLARAEPGVDEDLGEPAELGVAWADCAAKNRPITQARGDRATRDSG